MWNRFDLKEYARGRLNTNYWRMVLAAFIVGLLSNGGNTAARFKFNPSDLKEFYTWRLKNDYNAYGMGYSYGGGYGSLRDIFGDLFGFGSSHEAGRISWSILFIVLIVMLIAFVIAGSITIFLKNPLKVGGCRFFMENHSTDAKIEAFGCAFKFGYKNVVIGMLMMDMYIFLWSLLLIIPGIVKAYEYRMVPYLLADNPNMPYRDALETSSRMMEGNKWDAFVLDLSFIGWNILSVLTFGLLGIFYVNPYQMQTGAELYFTLRYRPVQPMSSVPDERNYMYNEINSQDW